MTSRLFHNNHSVLRLDDDGNVSQRALFKVEVFLMYIYVPPGVSLIFFDLLTIKSQHTALRLLLLLLLYLSQYYYYYCTVSTSTSTATIEIASLVENLTMLLNKNGTC